MGKKFLQYSILYIWDIRDFDDFIGVLERLATYMEVI